MVQNPVNFCRRSTVKDCLISFSVAALGLLFSTGCQITSIIYPDAPTIIPRAAWHAQEPNINALAEHGLFNAETNPDGWLVYHQQLNEILKTVVIHHSALPQSIGPLEIQKLHMHERRFADIGYHFVVDANGRVFEGRSISVRGCHTAGSNSGTIGVVLLGNFEQSRPSEIQVRSTKTLIRYLSAKYSLTHLAGHKNFLHNQTLCPGKYLNELLAGFASDAKLSLGTDGYNRFRADPPAASPVSARPIYPRP